MSSALRSVALPQNGLAMLADPRTIVHGAGGVVNPHSSSRVSALGVGLQGPQYFFTFVYSFSFPLSPSPSIRSPGPCSSPREEVSKVLSIPFYCSKLGLL